MKYSRRLKASLRNILYKICRLYEKFTFSIFSQSQQVRHGIIIFNTIVIFYRDYKNVPIMLGRSDYFKNFDNNELTKLLVIKKIYGIINLNFPMNFLHFGNRILNESRNIIMKYYVLCLTHAWHEEKIFFHGSGSSVVGVRSFLKMQEAEKRFYNVKYKKQPY